MSSECIDNDNVKFPLNITGADLAMATTFATQATNRDKCRDENILKGFQKKYGINENIFEWKQDDSSYPYDCVPDPSKPENGCPNGTCNIISKDFCETIGNSDYPYKTDVSGTIKPGAKEFDQLKPFIAFRNDKCVFANPLSKRWCISPVSRQQNFQHGVTDVPPFSFDDSTGKCSMSEDYCNWMGKDFDSSKGDCVESTGQQIGEFILGNTIFRFFNDLVKKRQDGCFYNVEKDTNQTDLNTITNSEPYKQFKESYQKLDECKFLIDDRFVKNKTLIQKNFLPNVNLYMVEWNDKVDEHITYSFLESEIKHIYKPVSYTHLTLPTKA